MKAITLLTSSSKKNLTPEEEAQLAQELAAAYHRDEVSATSREVRRIAEKVRANLGEWARREYLKTNK
jgi:hypothetical protein